MGFAGGLTAQKSSGSKTTSTGSTKTLDISDDAVNKIIYDVLSADQGLAQLVSGQNIAGGSKSSTTSLMAQDFTTKIVGEIAKLRATEVTTGTASEQSKGSQIGANASADSAKKPSVICTELVRQGKLDANLHQGAYENWLKIHPLVKRGYWSWSTRVVPLMQRSDRVSNFLAPICTARYMMITAKRWNLLGALTIYLGHPICFLIGAVLMLGDIRVRIQIQSS